jgi:integrase
MSYLLTPSKFLDDSEVCELLSSLPRGRNGLLIELALRCGARASELLAISKGDLDSRHRTVFIKGLKGSNDRYVTLPRVFFDKLKYYADKQTGPLVFDIGYTRFHQIWEHYRPASKKKIHALRHTFAINLYKACKDLHIVKQCLGHKSLNNTMIYLDFVNSHSVIDKHTDNLYGNSKRET